MSILNVLKHPSQQAKRLFKNKLNNEYSKFLN